LIAFQKKVKQPKEKKSTPAKFTIGRNMPTSLNSPTFTNARLRALHKCKHILFAYYCVI